MSNDARSDWEQRIGIRSGTAAAVDVPRLDPPAGLRADAGAAQVTLDWDPVPGAVGYQVHVADREDGEEWLSESYWLADIALADADPERVRAIAGAMERSLVRVKGWLDAQEEGSPDAPPELPSKAPEGDSK